MAPGASGIITVTGTVDTALAADVTLTNTVQITGTGDTTVANNNSSANISVTMPRFGFSDPAYGVGEAGGTATLTVTLSPANPFRDTSVQYATSDGTAMAGSDYISRSGTLSFPRGTALVTFTIPITDDLDAEPAETVQLDLSGPTGALLARNSSAALTINDNDSPGVTMQPLSVNVAEGGATAGYTVALNSRPTADVTINITTDGQTTINPMSLTFTSANWNTPQSVTVTAVDDAVAEDTHTGSISHSAASADGSYNGITISAVTATITDNDTSGVTIRPTSVDVAEGGATATYTVTLISQPTNNVTISIGADGQTTTSPANLMFTPANWNTPQIVTVTAVDDTRIEGMHTSTVSHRITSNDPRYDGISVTAVTATISDNDVASQGRTVYVPLVMKPGVADLVVTSVTLSPNKTSFRAGEPVEITVVIENRGTAAATPFWVDLYINPSQPPTLNQIWDRVCSLDPCFGLVWGVTKGLQPGERITLTSTVGSYASAYSRWPGWFAAGTTDIYVLADSWNRDQSTGAVTETDRTNNLFHLPGLQVAGANPSLPNLQSATPPERPARPVE